jgi:hypothetical protein
MGSIEVWPPTGELPRNPVFVLEGTVKFRDEVANLPQDRAYLTSDGDRTRLVEVRRFEGEATQLVLAPAEALEPGRTYQLVVERETRPASPPFYPRNRWHVRALPDRQRPSFTAPPRLALTRGLNFGWGPTTSIRFAIASSEEPVLVLVDVGLDDGYYRDRDRLLLFLHKGQVDLYSGPCDSNFRPRAGERYAASFALMDAAGNLGGGGPAYRVTFEAPDPSRDARESFGAGSQR